MTTKTSERMKSLFGRLERLEARELHGKLDRLEARFGGSGRSGEARMDDGEDDPGPEAVTEEVAITHADFAEAASNLETSRRVSRAFWRWRDSHPDGKLAEFRASIPV